MVLDLGDKQQINVIKLTDLDNMSRISSRSLSLWVSDDNVSFTRMEDYKFLHDETGWYLYGFEAECRYVKVHYTHFDFAASDFIGILSEMISADYQEHFGITGETTTAATEILNDTASAWQDQAVKITGLTGDAGTRVYLDGELLYHYVENGEVVVRIPDLAAGASAELTIVSGPADSKDISNKEAVYEVTF